MNDILTDTAKSFKIMRPKTNSGTFKPMSTYTKKRDKTLFLPIVDSENDIVKALNTLMGPIGIKKSFFNYFFLKRYIWRSVLYPKPVVREYIDEKEKNSFVKSQLHLGGRSGNRIYNLKNLIVDYTDIFKLLVPEERTIMIKPAVISYLQNIYPELICYILFNNPKHNKKNDIEESAEDLTDARPDDDAKNIPSGFQYIDNPDDKLLEPYEEMKDNEFEDLKAQLEMSDESFNEYLTKELKSFAMGGQGLGLSAYGFDKFIISFNFKLTSKTYLSKAFITQRIPLPRNVKLDPSIIYQIMFIQFLYEAYCCYYGEPLKSTTSDFISEICKHNVTFHIYCDTGVGFCINFKEIKENFKYKPLRFLAMIILRLNLLTMCNTGVVTDKDLDKLEEETLEKEYTQVSSAVSDDSDNLKKELKKDIKSVLDTDLAIRTLIKSKTTNEIVASNEPSEEVPENKDHLIITPENVQESKTAMAELKKITNIFGKASSATKEPVVDDDGTTELSDVDINDMFDAADEFNEEEISGDDYDEEVEDDELDETESENIVEEALDEMDDDPVGIGNANEIASDNDFEDDIDLLEYEFNEPDTDVVEEEYEDDDVEVLKAKTIKNVDVNYIDPNKRSSNLSAADLKRIEILKDKYKSIKIDGTPVTDIIGNAKKIQIESTVNIGTKKPRTKDPDVTKLNAIDFQKSYVKNNYQPDIINAVRSLSVNKDVPLYITNIKVDDTSDQFNDRLTYQFTLEDQFKKKHELKFNVPKLDDNGFMKIQGRTKYLKNQLIRKPVVKIGSDKVYITTQLNSYQVMRNGYTLNKVSEVVRRLVTEYFVDNPNVRIERGDCSKNNENYITTIEYDIFADKYFYININDESDYGEHVIIYFDQGIIRDKIKEHNIPTGFKDNELPPYILPIAIN